MHADLEQGQGDGVHAVACEAAPSLGTKRFIYQGEGGMCGVTRRGCMRVEISPLRSSSASQQGGTLTGNARLPSCASASCATARSGWVQDL